MTSPLELIYFDGASRGEAIRVAFTAGKVPFVDTRIKDWSAFKAAQAEGKYTAGLPVLKVSGSDKEYAQSLAILRYAGKLAVEAVGSAADNPASKLYPSDHVQALAVDQALDIVQDAMTKCPQDPDADTKKKLREEYAAGKLKVFCGQLESLITSSGPFVTGSDLTIADLHICFVLCDGISSGSWDYISKTYLDENFPKIAALGKAVKESKMVVDYYAGLKK